MRKAKAVARTDTLDRLFAGACTAMFLVLMGSVVQAVYLYWR